MIDGTAFAASGVLGRLLRLPLRLVPARSVLRILSGPARGARWVAGSAPHGCWLGTYERESQRLAQAVIRPGDTVYDLGANVGFFTLVFSRLVGVEGHVVAFEPVSRNLEFLRQHLELNGTTNVQVIAAAVGDRAGPARFAPSLDPRQGRLAADGAVEVPGTSLDAEVFARGAPTPRVIKMDIEGAEVQALGGARRLLLEAGPTVWVETHGWVAHQECLEVLRSLGYRATVEQPPNSSGHGRLVGRSSRSGPGQEPGRTAIPARIRRARGPE